MKNDELYTQLSKLVDEYLSIKKTALEKVTDFADTHGLIVSIHDNYIDKQTYYVPQYNFDEIKWEDKIQAEAFGYLKSDFRDEKAFNNYVIGNWVTSSHLC